MPSMLMLIKLMPVFDLNLIYSGVPLCPKFQQCRSICVSNCYMEIIFTFEVFMIRGNDFQFNTCLIVKWPSYSLLKFALTICIDIFTPTKGVILEFAQVVNFSIFNLVYISGHVSTSKGKIGVCSSV